MNNLFWVIQKWLYFFPFRCLIKHEEHTHEMYGYGFKSSYGE